MAGHRLCNTEKGKKVINRLVDLTGICKVPILDKYPVDKSPSPPNDGMIGGCYQLN